MMIVGMVVNTLGQRLLQLYWIRSLQYDFVTFFNEIPL